MRIQLVKSMLVGTVWHDAGDVVEVDDQRGLALIKRGGALKITITGPDKAAEAEPDELVLRQAVAVPPKRKSRKG
jgi:hypothetical protein